VLFFDSNKNFHAHPNKEIGNGGNFLSILDLEFSVQFISELKFLHPNRPLEEKYQQKAYERRTKPKQKIKETKQQSSRRGKFYPEITYYTEDFGYWTVFCTLQWYIFVVVYVDHTFLIPVQYNFQMVATHRQNN
jgi:hypothetical protein